MDFVWNVTGRCNLRCPGCWDPYKAEGTTPYDDLMQTLDGLDLPSCKVVTFTGGEPLLHRDIFRLMKKVREAGVPQVKICTNGTLLKRKARALIESGVTEVHVSLDSIDEDAHASIGNADPRAAAPLILREVAAFQEEVRQAGAQIAIVLVAVLDPRVLARFERVLTYAEKQRYQVSYQLLCPFADWVPYVTAEYGEVRAFFAMLESLHQRYRGTLNFFNWLYLAAAKRYALTGEHEPCGANEAFQVIDPNGARHACYRPNSDPVNMGCFDERCLIWCRSRGRGEGIVRMLAARSRASQ